MSEIDELIRRDVERRTQTMRLSLSPERVRARKDRLRLWRRMQVVALTLAMVAGTGGGAYAVARAFHVGVGRQPAGGGGQQIVFTSDRTGNDELFAMRPDGGGVVELTHDPADDYAPSWSPEGTMIAFVNYTDANRGDIWVIDADGSHPHGLTSGSRRDWWPAWSPDGTTIAFSGEYQIYTMSADGSGLTRLTSLQNASYPAWSPDGARIAFTGDDGRGNGLWVMNADGTDQHQVFRESNIEAGDRLVAGAWSPDGRWILIARSDPGTGHCEDSDLYRIRPDGTGLVRLTHDTFSAEGAWSADGTRIVFSRTFEPSCTSETYEMNPDGSGLVALTRGPANNFDANWRR